MSTNHDLLFLVAIMVEMATGFSQNLTRERFERIFCVYIFYTV